MPKMSTDVAAFHRKHGFPIGMDLKAGMKSGASTRQLNWLAGHLSSIAERIKPEALDDQKIGDERLYRAHLMIEELAEALEALHTQDEVALADATADLRYVVVGTDVTFGIPSEYVDEEVHRSNMSKKIRTADDLRMRDKGPDYKAPDVIGAIHAGRAMLDWTRKLKEEVGS